MILIDTSAWTEFLRDPGSATRNRVEALLASHIAPCDVIRTEVLAGAPDDRHLQALRRLLARTTVIPTRPTDYDEAAALYRLCRREGGTVHKMIDCLTSAIALRAGVSVLPCDVAFRVLACHTGLRGDAA